MVEAGHGHGGRGQAAPPVLAAAAAPHWPPGAALVLGGDDGLLLVRGEHGAPTWTSSVSVGQRTFCVILEYQVL